MAGFHDGGLRLTDHPEEGRHTLVLSGELDLATCAALVERVALLCEQDPGEIALDLRGVSFMDSTGLHAVLRSLELCDDHDCRFAVIADDGPCRRLFELTGVAKRLPLREPPAAPSSPSSS